MLTNAGDLGGRYTSFIEEVRRIGETQGRRRGIAGRMHLLIAEMFIWMLRLIARHAEAMRAGKLSDTAPEGPGTPGEFPVLADRGEDGVPCAAVRPVGEVHPRGANGGSHCVATMPAAGGQGSERAATAAPGSHAQSLEIGPGRRRRGRNTWTTAVDLDGAGCFGFGRFFPENGVVGGGWSRV